MGGNDQALVIPFCTAYSGPSSTLDNIVNATPDSEHRNGLCIVTKEMGGKGIDKNFPEIDTWLNKIDF